MRGRIEGRIEGGVEGRVEGRIEGRGEESRLSGGVDADEKPRSTGGELVLA